MVRKLKFHEKKLLKKVDFISWEVDGNLSELKVLRRYRIQRREDYTTYNKLSREVRELARKIRDIDAKDSFRAKSTSRLVEKLLFYDLMALHEVMQLNLQHLIQPQLSGWGVVAENFLSLEQRVNLDQRYSLGLIPTRQGLQLCEKVSASSFCRRRLPTIMVKLRMAQSLKMAITFIEQGHVRIGPEVVTDPAFLVTRNMEDFITWVDSSKIKQHVMEYNEERDDFDLVV